MSLDLLNALPSCAGVVHNHEGRNNSLRYAMTFVTVKRDVEVRIPVQEKLNNSWKYAMAVIILDVLQVSI